MASRLPDPAFWRGRRVLLTGHTGFKGAWCLLWLRRLGADVRALALPPVGDQPLFERLAPWPGLVETHVDLNDAGAILAAITEWRPEIVLHLAAQALVRRSYDQPLATFATNVMGTINLLDAIRRVGGVEAVLVITSDKVYRNSETGRRFVEDDPLGGRDPYSASKAAVEIVTASWRDSFLKVAGTPVATARAGNVIGGGDVAADRLVPDFFRALDREQPLMLRNPGATRPWQFVVEPLAGYLVHAETLVARAEPLAVNFGPDPSAEWPVRRVIESLIGIVGMGEWRQDGDPGPHEARTLALDPTLAGATLGWRPVLDVTTALTWTAAFWQAQRAGDDLRRLCLSQIDAYCDLAR